MACVLVIDDDPAIRTMFGRALRTLREVEVEEASGGAHALRMLAARAYDLLLLDLHMPGVDGFAVLQALASKPGPNHDTPVFLVTADPSVDARAQALRQGAVFLLSKPVHLATMLSLVEKTLQKRTGRTPAPQVKAKAG